MKTEVMKNLTIENAVSVLEELKKEVKKKKDSIIDLSSVEKIDLSGIQLLVSAQNTAESKSKSLFYKGTLKKSVFDKFSNNGFSLVPEETDGELYRIRRSSGEF